MRSRSVSGVSVSDSDSESGSGRSGSGSSRDRGRARRRHDSSSEDESDSDAGGGARRGGNERDEDKERRKREKKEKKKLKKAEKKARKKAKKAAKRDAKDAKRRAKKRSRRDDGDDGDGDGDGDGGDGGEVRRHDDAHARVRDVPPPPRFPDAPEPTTKKPKGGLETRSREMVESEKADAAVLAAADAAARRKAEEDAAVAKAAKDAAEEEARAKLAESVDATPPVPGFGAAMTLIHPGPAGADAQPWSTTLSGSYIETQYFAPDPAVDPNRARRDSEWRGTLLTTIPITADWALIATLQRTVVNSNFKNFTYNNNSASIGASVRF